jgi:MOSC domain-containing protein YiiM
VSRSPAHTLSKPNEGEIEIVAGLGVEGDVHSGATVKHRSRNKSLPNLRQVHLIQSELFEELRGRGFAVAPGQMGENVTTQGIDLLQLPTGTRLHLGDSAVVEVTGLRNPCKQLNKIQKGLMKAVMPNGARKAGIMSIALAGGRVRVGDPIRVVLPDEPHRPLEPV